VTRVARFRLGWFAAAAILVVALALLLPRDGGPMALFAVAVVLLLPGRIMRTFYRDMLAGRRLMAQGKYEKSAEFSRRFLETIRERPGLKRVMWLSWPGKTADAEAMVLNNLAAAEIELGEWDAASGHLADAIEIDPEYSVPRVNLALLAAIRGDREQAERLLAQATSLGYARSRIEPILKHGDELRARYAPAASA
jgi:tetratricopeptide (TPR) repeat protein